MTTTRERIAAIQAHADRAGLPPETMQGLWQQLAPLTREGRTNLLARWEETAASWPDGPCPAHVARKLARLAYLA